LVSVAVVFAFLLAVILATVAVYAARYKVVPPDSALVVYGRVMDPRMRRGYVILTEGGKLILPIIECYERLDLTTQKIELDLRDVKVTHEGVDRLAQVRAIAEVGIGDFEDVLHVAAEHLLHVSQADIGRMAREAFEGWLRVHLRKVPFEQASEDPMAIASEMHMTLSKDLMNVGIAIKDIMILELKLRGGDGGGPGG
jgi:uncharacterized membrane protein YqiK